MSENKKDIALARTAENKKTKDFFIGCMKGKMYEFDGKIISKGYVEVVFQNGGRRIRARDVNPEHKFPHIVTCLTPINKSQFDTFYMIMELDIKEVGVEAYRARKRKVFLDADGGSNVNGNYLNK